MICLVSGCHQMTSEVTQVDLQYGLQGDLQDGQQVDLQGNPQGGPQDDS